MYVYIYIYTCVLSFYRALNVGVFHRAEVLETLSPEVSNALG